MGRKGFGMVRLLVGGALGLWSLAWSAVAVTAVTNGDVFGLFAFLFLAGLPWVWAWRWVLYGGSTARG